MTFLPDGSTRYVAFAGNDAPALSEAERITARIRAGKCPVIGCIAPPYSHSLLCKTHYVTQLLCAQCNALVPREMKGQRYCRPCHNARCAVHRGPPRFANNAERWAHNRERGNLARAALIAKWWADPVTQQIITLHQAGVSAYAIGKQVGRTTSSIKLTLQRWQRRQQEESS